MVSRDVAPLSWYGVWLFVDWLGFGGTKLTTPRTRSR